MAELREGMLLRDKELTALVESSRREVEDTKKELDREKKDSATKVSNFVVSRPVRV